MLTKAEVSELVCNTRNWERLLFDRRELLERLREAVKTCLAMTTLRFDPDNYDPSKGGDEMYRHGFHLAGRVIVDRAKDVLARNADLMEKKYEN